MDRRTSRGNFYPAIHCRRLCNTLPTNPLSRTL
uniref:Uncharacterized protein n=1 Tax=Siphoviridae sp. ctUWs1 TaxID=2826352 RepID=A0A8S5QV10_9CAUD|nr:MAG TPA: hypothetical protein [Siphoviridae sp. ctUWs1]